MTFETKPISRPQAGRPLPTLPLVDRLWTPSRPPESAEDADSELAGELARRAQPPAPHWPRVFPGL